MKNLKIEVVAEEISKDILYLSEDYGSGKLGDTKFKASFLLPERSLKIDLDKKSYRVSLTGIIAEVIRKHEAKK